MPRTIKQFIAIFKWLFRFNYFKREPAGMEAEVYGAKPVIKTTGIKDILQDIYNVMPFLIRADLNDFPNDEFIYNPVGNEKLLKKIAEDLAATFILTGNKGQPVIADKAVIAAFDTSADQLANIAEQNIQKLFQERQVVKTGAPNKTLYTIVLNNRNEASCMFSKKIWDAVSVQHKNYILVSVPRYNEIFYCTLDGNTIPDLITYTTQRYNSAGSEALSPNIYLYHNSSWVMFTQGHEQILEYCLKHDLI